MSEVSPYEWMAQEFDRLAILRKMWSADEVAAILRRHDIERDTQPRIDHDLIAHALRFYAMAAAEGLSFEGLPNPEDVLFPLVEEDDQFDGPCIREYGRIAALTAENERLRMVDRNERRSD